MMRDHKDHKSPIFPGILLRDQADTYPTMAAQKHATGIGRCGHRGHHQSTTWRPGRSRPFSHHFSRDIYVKKNDPKHTHTDRYIYISFIYVFIYLFIYLSLLYYIFIYIYIYINIIYIYIWNICKKNSVLTQLSSSGSTKPAAATDSSLRSRSLPSCQASGRLGRTAAPPGNPWEPLERAIWNGGNMGKLSL